MRRCWTVGVLFALAGLGTGCPSTEVFVCISDDDCNSQTDGQCEPTGFCSFPDEACATGRRYGEAAGDGLSRRCVPAEHQTGTGTDTDVASTASMSMSTSTTADGSGSSSPTTPANTTSTSTTNDDSSSTWMETWPSSSTGSSGSDASSGSTTGQPVECEVVLADEFDSDDLQPLWQTESSNFVLTGDAIEFNVSAEEDFYNFIITADAYAGEGLEFRWSVLDGPDLDYTQQIAALTRRDTTESLDLLIDSEFLVVRHWDENGDFSDLAAFDYDPRYTWLQIRAVGAEVVFEQSMDEVNFETLYTYDFDIRQWDAEAWLGGGNWQTNAMDEVITFGAARLCAIPDQ